MFTFVAISDVISVSNTAYEIYDKRTMEDIILKRLLPIIINNFLKRACGTYI